MSIVEKYVQKALEIANDDSHGYDQINRWGDDYDCSSLVITAVENSGIKVVEAGATYTGNMLFTFKKCGFKDVTKTITLSSGNGLKRGDVLLNVKKHTAIYGERSAGPCFTQRKRDHLRWKERRPDR